MAHKTLEITTKIGCRMMCKYCPQDLLISKYKDKNIELTLENFKKAIDKVPKEVRIDFSGMSESWLVKDATEMLLYAHEKGHPIAVYTTGVGMTFEDVEKIKNVPFEIFVLHVPDREHNSRIPLDRYYVDLMEVIKSAGLFHFEVMSMGFSNDTFIRIFKRVNVSKMHTRAGNVEAPSSASNIGNVSCDGNPNPERGVLLPNGDVVICCMDYGLKHKIGNLLKQDYKQIYSSEEYKKVVKGLKNSSEDVLCRRCLYAR